MAHWPSDLTGCPASLLVLFPSSHYEDALGYQLTEQERARGVRLDDAVARWRTGGSARSLMTLDPFAARLWAARPGAPVFWLPEPPVAAPAAGTGLERPYDAVFFGAFAHRKGLSRLVGAVARMPANTSVLLAGWVEQSGYEHEVQRAVADMRLAGARVDVVLRYHNETDALRVLASARCSVIPYLRHFGMSRVLLESCTVETPVVVHDFGLLAHLVRESGVGMAVDCADASATTAAIGCVAEAWSSADVRDRCRRFAGGYSRETFQRVVREALL